MASKMFKIMNLIEHVNQQTPVGIGNDFMESFPAGKFQETEDPAEADAYLVFVTMNNYDVQCDIVTLSLWNTEYIAKLAKGIGEKPIIGWIDVNHHIDVSPTESVMTEKFNQLMQAKDIPVAPTSIPDHPNGHPHVFQVMNRDFYHSNRFARKPNSVIIMEDQFTSDFQTIMGIMPSISELYISNFNDHHISDETKASFEKYKDKIKYGNSDYPSGVRKMLQQYEYVLSVRDWVGMELMGFEGGMCGAHPIYPDTPMYREMFDGSGVKLFDLANPVDSISKIVSEKSTWVDEHMADFTNKYCGENNIPLFWDSVYDILTKHYAGEFNDSDMGGTENPV